MERVRRRAREAGLDALVVSPGPDLRYLTGYPAQPLERFTCLVVPATDEACLLTPALDVDEAAAALEDLPGVGIRGWGEGEDPYALAASLLPGSGVVAVDDRMWAAQLLALAGAAPGRELRAAGDLLGSLRARKDAAEIEALRVAGATGDRVFSSLASWVREGRSELEVAADLRAAMLRAGHASADYVIVASGPNAARPHHEASDRVLARGDSVVVDLAGAMPSGYWSDCTRTCALGPPGGRFAAAYAVLRDAQRSAVAAVRPGVAAGAVDAAARDVIAAAGYGDRFTHRTGHGVGLEVHERPYVVAGGAQPLLEGMVFSVEPGIYVPGDFGARIEDIVVCTAGGGERLNQTSRDLLVIDA